MAHWAHEAQSADTPQPPPLVTLCYCYRLTCFCGSFSATQIISSEGMLQSVIVHTNWGTLSGFRGFTDRALTLQCELIVKDVNEKLSTL